MSATRIEGPVKAIFRCGADAWYRQGGEGCEVIATQESDGGTLFRVRLADGTELWAEADEVVLEGEAAAPSDPAQAALPGISSEEPA